MYSITTSAPDSGAVLNVNNPEYAVYPRVMVFLVEIVYVSRSASWPFIVTTVLPTFRSGLHVNGHCNLEPVPINVSLTSNFVIK